MRQPLGLSTYRWNNNLKSMVLLGAFPLLLLSLLYGFFLILGWVQTDPSGQLSPWTGDIFGLQNLQSPLTPWSLASAGLEAYWHYALGGAGIWLAIGMFFNERLIHFATKATPVIRKDQPEIYNLLENLCLSRGLKMPHFYMIDTQAMNAYASGLSEKSFAITLTRGLVETLNKEEIEAVLAHELSHIINRDVRLLVITVLFGGMLGFFAEMLWRSMRHRPSPRSHKKGGGAALLIAAILISVGYLISLLLRLALSRRREYLADAGAVALTKRPEAMITALKKIKGHAAMPDTPSGIQAMMIENPPSFFDFLDTHPSIEKRISVLQRLGGLPEKRGSIIPSVGNR